MESAGYIFNQLPDWNDKLKIPRPMLEAPLI